MKIRAWLSGVISLGVALLVAIALFDMSVDLALLSGTEGAAFGFFPIMWIVINAIWVYNLTVATGHFDVLRRSFEKVSPDQRVQAIIIAFCFGALLEALAGFGTPVAITVVMLMAMGFAPIKAAAVALIANTAPVAFGALATPIVTLAAVSSGASDDSGLTVDTLGSMVGRQTPFLALIVPLILVFVVDGRRGVRRTWPAAVVCGVAFAVAQFVAANYISVQLADIIAALVAAAAVVLLLRRVDPCGGARRGAEDDSRHSRRWDTRGCDGRRWRPRAAGDGRLRGARSRHPTGHRRSSLDRQRRQRGEGVRAVPRDRRDLLHHQHHRDQGEACREALHLHVRVAQPRRLQRRR